MRLSTLQIAWRNLGRNRKRTALAALAICVGQFALLASQGLMRGYSDNIRRAVTGPMIGHAQVHAPEWREERAMDLFIPNLPQVLRTIREQPHVRNAAGRIYAPVLVAPQREAFVATVVGLDVEPESKPYGLLSGSTTKLGEQDVLLGYRLARRIGAEPGAELAVIGQAADGSYATGLFTVREIMRTPSDMINQSGIVMRLAAAQQLFVLPDSGHEIVVRAEPGTDAETLTENLAPLASLQSLEIKPWTELVPELVLVIEMADYVGYFVLVLVFVAAIAGITNTLMMATFERMHELGMLLALGTRPGRLVKLIVVEAGLLGVVGTVAGTALGAVLVWIASETGIDMASWGGEHVQDLAYQGLRLPLDIYPRLKWQDPLIGLAAILFTSVLASLWPARVASQLEPMEAMRA